MSTTALGLALLIGFWLVPVMGQENTDCFACHSDKTLTGTRGGKSFPVFVDEKAFGGSVHSSLTCVSCHTDLEGKELPHTEGLAEVRCGICHASEQEQHTKSLHGKAIARGDALAPRCRDCHGTHDILSSKNRLSPTSVLKVPFLCGKCHTEGTPVTKQRTIHQDHILENFRRAFTVRLFS